MRNAECGMQNTNTIGKRVLFPFLGILLASLIIAQIGCGDKEEKKAETIADIQKRDGMPVKVHTVQKAELRVIEIAGGTVKGYNQTALKPSIPAKVVAVNVKVGSYVKENAVLVRLDSKAQASQYHQAKAGLDQTQKSYDRVKALVDEGGASQDMLDQVETGLKVARANFNAVNKMVNILAPFNGTVVEVNAKVNDNATPGGGPDKPPLVVLARLDRVQVDLKINESAINKYKKGQKAFVEVDNKTVYGTIADVAISGDKGSHSFPVKAVFKNRGMKLKPGMYVTVSTIVKQVAKALQVPGVAVIKEESGTSVFRVEDNKAVKTTVTLGQRSGDRYEVVKGLKESDQVVTQGISQLSDGVKVKVVN